MEAVLKTLDELREEELHRFQWYLNTIQSEGFPNIPRSDVYRFNRHDTVTTMRDRYGPVGAGEVTLTILRKMNHKHLADMLESELTKEQQRLEKERSPQQPSFQTLNTSPIFISEFQVFSTQLKKALVQNFERIMVGDSETGHRKFLNDIYTDLYIVENETGGVIEEHEVRQIEASSFRPSEEEIPIKCSDVFKLQADGNRRNRKVFTMGIAGVGKTFSVTKFILDWAEGKENQDIEFIFPLPFRELNMKKDEEFSLMELLNEFVLHSNELTSLPLDDGKVMFIFDGLDECRFSLNFDDTKRLKDINEKTSLGTIITNLIKRNLLPSALIWITSRPAAAHLIPRDYIDYLTEVRGFNDEQRKDYFRKCCTEDLATKIITHIMNSRSLYIMCQIPVFCWISISVFETLPKDKDTPTTLTEMYTKFVLQQSYNMKKKYCEKRESFNFEKVFVQLGKLALRNLERGDLIFYEEDLVEYGIDSRFGLVYSGVCTQIFRQNQSASGRKTFSFVHLSFQEFFAALYVLHRHCKTIKRNALQPGTLKNIIKWRNKSTADLLEYALKKAVQSKNGHMDLFVRFLSGLCEESNQQELREILPKLKTEMKAWDRRRMVVQTEVMLDTNISTAASLNILECLIEMKEDSFVTKIQGLYGEVRKGKDWSILLYKLLSSERIHEKFDLKKYSQSNEGFFKLLPVIKITKRALLDNAHIDAYSCEYLPSVFSADSPLRELDLCENSIQDTGMKLLCDGLRSSHSKLEILKMCFCGLTERSGETLASVLSSASSHLREVDLSNNDLQNLGVQFISEGLKNPQCKLEILRLSGCLVTEEGCSYLASSLRSNCSSQLSVLDLSYNKPGSTGEEMFAELLHNPHWNLETVRMDHGGEIRIKPGLLKYACNLTWDLNTASRLVVVFENGENLRNTDLMVPVERPDHPDRFDDVPQVLCKEPLSGRCYWEVNYSGFLIMAVSYKRIDRKGPASAFGRNDVSWCLICTLEDCALVHNNSINNIPEYKSIMYMNYWPSTPSKLGVYLDSEAGTLSFYNSEKTPRVLLHRLHVKFTEPLYVGFRFDPAFPSQMVVLTKF